MSTGIFIVIEALDGVGKTTLVHNLAHALGGVATATPGPALGPLRGDVLEALGDDQLARALFYASSVVAMGNKARRRAADGEVLVMDRYWASTVAYARARGVEADLEALDPLVPPADLTVLLTLDEDERRRRLAARGDMTAADRETLDTAFREAAYAGLRARADLVVDMTGADRDEAVRRVLEAVARRRD